MRSKLSLLVLFAVLVGQLIAYDVVLKDDPVGQVHLVFDCKYKVGMGLHKNGALPQGPWLYVMTPEDQQSEVMVLFVIGEGFHAMTEKMFAEKYGAAKVTKVDAVIGGLKAQWWYYGDSHFFYSYSNCRSIVTYRSGALPIYVHLTATSPERLASLKDSFAKIEIAEKPANKAAEPTSTAVTPPAGAGDRASGASGSP